MSVSTSISTMSLPTPSESTSTLRSLLPESLHHPSIAIVCGSGLSGLADLLDDRVDLEYSKLGWPSSTVVGHGSKLCFGRLAGVAVVAQAGRYHSYEGKPMSLVTYPVRVFSALGCRAIILTNAAGGLNPDFAVPTICVVKDHISLPALSGLNPLVGPNDDSAGPRFPPMSNAYDNELQRIAFKAGLMLDLPSELLQSGIYCQVTGPNYETRADCKFLREAMGADLVGMSTVPEVIVARHAGMRVLCLSLVTNKVVSTPYRDVRAEARAELEGSSGSVASSETKSAPAKKQQEKEEEAVGHEEVLETGRLASKNMSSLVTKIVELAGAVL